MTFPVDRGKLSWGPKLQEEPQEHKDGHPYLAYRNSIHLRRSGHAYPKPYLDPQSKWNYCPQPLRIAQKAIILHTSGVQVDPKSCILHPRRFGLGSKVAGSFDFEIEVCPKHPSSPM